MRGEQQATLKIGSAFVKTFHTKLVGLTKAENYGKR